MLSRSNAPPLRRPSVQVLEGQRRRVGRSPDAGRLRGRPLLERGCLYVDDDRRDVLDARRPSGSRARRACEPTVTVLTPKSFVKKPVAGRLRLTLIVSLATSSVESVTVARADRRSWSRTGGPACLRCRVRRERLRARERRGVGRRLRRAVGAVPRPDVEDERRHAEQHDEKDEGQDGCLAAVAARVHSTRSVVVLERRPVFTTNAEQADLVRVGRGHRHVRARLPGRRAARGEVRLLEVVAEFRIAVWHAPPGSDSCRPTAALRAPARVASVSVT